MIFWVPGLVLLTLKLAGVLNWSWLAVLSPFIAWVTFVVLLYAIAGVALGGLAKLLKS